MFIPLHDATERLGKGKRHAKRWRTDPPTVSEVQRAAAKADALEVRVGTLPLVNDRLLDAVADAISQARNGGLSAPWVYYDEQTGKQLIRRERVRRLAKERAVQNLTTVPRLA